MPVPLVDHDLARFARFRGLDRRDLLAGPGRTHLAGVEAEIGDVN